MAKSLKSKGKVREKRDNSDEIGPKRVMPPLRLFPWRFGAGTEEQHRIGRNPERKKPQNTGKRSNESQKRPLQKTFAVAKEFSWPKHYIDWKI